MHMFEYALRHKLRFQSSRGELTTEQLWDVPLRSKDDFNLNTVAGAASKALKDATENNFVETARSPKQDRLQIAFEVVKYVIDAKIFEEGEAKKRAERKAEKEQLLAILAEKQKGELSDLSVKQLQKRIDALED
jgi:hypothetical protein